MTMKKIVFILFMMFSCQCVMADQNTVNISTSQTGGRYEIVQSPFLRKCLFKLDKYTGKVYQYVIGSDNEGIWKSLIILDKKEPDNKNRINFQLFFGGIAAADVFLLNIYTGDTYNLKEDEENDMLFFNIVETTEFQF